MGFSCLITTSKKHFEDYAEVKTYCKYEQNNYPAGAGCQCNVRKTLDMRHFSWKLKLAQCWLDVEFWLEFKI